MKSFRSSMKSVFSRKHRRPKSYAQTGQRPRRTAFEPLEDRRLLAADFEWIKQFGETTPGQLEDVAQAVASDGSGNTYVAGWTMGWLGGFAEGITATGNTTHRDAFLRKYDASGTVVWTQQLG